MYKSVLLLHIVCGNLKEGLTNGVHDLTVVLF